MNDDLSYQVIELLAQSIDLTVPKACKEGVLKNTEILHGYSKLIHQFEIPEMNKKGG